MEGHCDVWFHKEADEQLLSQKPRDWLQTTPGAKLTGGPDPAVGRNLGHLIGAKNGWRLVRRILDTLWCSCWVDSVGSVRFCCSALPALFVCDVFHRLLPAVSNFSG